MTKLLHASITDKAWRAYYTVYNAHGHDYPEAFFEEMMRLEFEALGVPCATQVQYAVTYKGVKVGEHITDAELDGCVVLEYKVAAQLLPRHQAQLISNLKVSGKSVGLLFNFGGTKPEGLRRVWTPKEIAPLPVWNPDAPDGNLLYPDLTLTLRHAAQSVYYELGPGLLQRVYVNAMRVEMQLLGIQSERLRRLAVMHRGRPIGEVLFRHFVVDNKLVLAPVTVSEIGPSQINKVRAVLRQREMQLGMIVNFRNERLEVKYVRR